MANIISRIAGTVARKLPDSAIDATLKLAAALPGDPVTRGIKTYFKDDTVKRTGPASWTLTRKSGEHYEGSVSGHNVTIKGPEGTATRPIEWPEGLDLRLPKVPAVKLPTPDVGKLVNALTGP